MAFSTGEGGESLDPRISATRPSAVGLGGEGVRMKGHDAARRLASLTLRTWFSAVVHPGSPATRRQQE